MDNKWKVGDWCWYDAELYQVDGVEDGKITSLNDGFFRRAGTSFIAYPLTLHGKITASFISGLYDSLYKKASRIFNNWPAINEKKNQLFNEIMDAYNDNVKYQVALQKTEQFFNSLEEELEKTKTTTTEGINLYVRD